VIVVWALCLAGCASGSGMSYSFQHTIPKGASVVRVQSDLPPAALFSTASSVLIQEGFGFSKLDSSSLTIETDAVPVGQSKTPLRVTIRVVSGPMGSALEATGKTLQGLGNWGPAGNTPDSKSKVAFQELVLLVGKVPNREVSYLSSN